MPLSKDHYTSEDYWNLPEGERAELIGGKFYDIAPPSQIHQEISEQIYKTLANYIDARRGSCKVYAAPFAVNLDANDKDWVAPDISVICDPNKLTDRGCSGAPDLIFEIVSPASRKLDYGIKNGIYSQSGVREYWIVDPAKEKVVVYYYDRDSDPCLYSYDSDIPVGIYPGLSIKINDLLKNY